MKKTTTEWKAHVRGDVKLSLLLATNLSQKFTEPSKGISYPFGDLRSHFTKLTGPSVFTLHSNQIHQQMVQMAFCDLSHTFRKQVINVFQHICAILIIMGNFYMLTEWGSLCIGSLQTSAVDAN